MINIKVCVLTNYKYLENPALMLTMQERLFHFDSEECSTVNEQPGFVISWCFMVVHIVTTSTLLTL